MTSAEEIYRRAEAAFGRRHQEQMLIEEMAEFIHAWNKVLRHTDPWLFNGGATQVDWDLCPNALSDMIEEFLDVQIVMEQFERFMIENGTPLEAMQLRKKEKLERLEYEVSEREKALKQRAAALKEMS